MPVQYQVENFFYYILNKGKYFCVDKNIEKGNFCCDLRA